MPEKILQVLLILVFCCNWKDNFVSKLKIRSHNHVPQVLKLENHVTDSQNSL